jgi:hypothetical protein
MVYPELVSYSKEILLNMHTFVPQKQHAVMMYFTLLPKIMSSSDIPVPISLSDIVNTVLSLNPGGFYKAVILRDLSMIIRRWLKFIEDFEEVYGILRSIRDNSDNDLVVIYECCLTIKQILYKNPSQTLCEQILNDFSFIVFKILSSVAVPSVIWHLMTFIVTILEKTAFIKSSILIQSLSITGLNSLLNTDNEMLRIALADMCECLVLCCPDEPSVLEIVTSYITIQMLKGGEEPAIKLWQFLVSNIDAKPELLPLIDNLLPLLNPALVLDKTLGLKILEEYYFLNYTACRSAVELDQFISYVILPNCALTGNTEQDSYILSCLDTIAICHYDKLSSYLAPCAGYLNVGTEDIFSTQCLVLSLYIVNKILIAYPARIAEINPELWLEAQKNITSPNHNKVNCVALLNVLPLLPASIIPKYGQLIGLKVVPFVESFQLSGVGAQGEGEHRRRRAATYLIPSSRKVSLVKKDPALQCNLMGLFKICTQALRNNGVRLEDHVVDVTIKETLLRLLKDTHARSSSK